MTDRSPQSHLQWGYEVGWFAEVQGLGRSALKTACYPQGSSKEAAWRIVAEFPWSLERSCVLQGACCSAPLTLPSRVTSLGSRGKASEGKERRVGQEPPGSGGRGAGPGAPEAAAHPSRTPPLSPVFLSYCLSLLPATVDMHRAPTKCQPHLSHCAHSGKQGRHNCSPLSC